MTSPADGRRRIPDHALTLWQQGYSAPQIVKRLGVVEGSRFQVDSVRNFIKLARRAGDPRAERLGEPGCRTEV